MYKKILDKEKNSLIGAQISLIRPWDDYFKKFKKILDC